MFCWVNALGLCLCWVFGAGFSVFLGINIHGMEFSFSPPSPLGANRYCGQREDWAAVFQGVLYLLVFLLCLYWVGGIAI